MGKMWEIIDTSRFLPYRHPDWSLFIIHEFHLIIHYFKIEKSLDIKSISSHIPHSLGL
jgi:hypothetical protein